MTPDEFLNMTVSDVLKMLTDSDSNSLEAKKYPQFRWVALEEME